MRGRKGQQRKKNADEGGVNGMWNEIDRKVSKANGMLNERRNGQRRRMLARAEGMEC